MHKRLFNEAKITLTISPDGPILIKAGESGVDPTRPDMEFVRTLHGGRETIYLPGSSLKGVLRAHCERIARTLQEKAPSDAPPLSCNPLREGNRWGRGDFACSKYFERKDVKDELERLEKAGGPVGAVKHERSCFICQLFGNTSLASHLRLTDGYPLGEVETEERNGVAIDRVFGSVAVGPFQFEVCTEGDFQTTIYIKNFTLAQLGLLALALRDLEAGRVGVGFGKSRGLGRVKAGLDTLVLRYPLCQVANGALRILGREQVLASSSELLGVGAFLDILASAERAEYGYPANDKTTLPQGLVWGEGELGEAELKLEEVGQIKALWRVCVPKWAEVLAL